MNTNTQQQALLGILGGMGPLATVDFLTKLTRLTPAHCDQDHLPWITISQPGIPDRSAAIKAGCNIPSLYLTKGVAWLAEQGVQLIAVPCNTSHFWFDLMQEVSPVPILHIADATIEELQRHKKQMGSMGAIAILATRGTMQAGIYSKRLLATGFELAIISEDEQCVVDQIIHDVKCGEIEKSGVAMNALLLALAACGIDTAILGCTELPIAHAALVDEELSGVRTIDTSLALASASLRRLGYW